MRRRKSDWLQISVGGLLGAFFGLGTAFFTMWDDGPQPFNPIEVSIIELIACPREKVWETDVTLNVKFFGRWEYERLATNVEDVKAEALAWRLTPGVIVIGLGFAIGVQGGAIISRWVRARRRGLPAGIEPATTGL